jgi:hypothetical protein
MIEQASAPFEGDVTVKNAASDGGSTVSTVDTVTSWYLATIVTAVVNLTVDVSTVNAFVVSPAAMETLAGTLTTIVSLLSRDIGAFPAGAGALSLTVPMGRAWLRTVASLSVIDSRTAGAGGAGGGVGAGVGTGVGAGGALLSHAAAKTTIRATTTGADARAHETRPLPGTADIARGLYLTETDDARLSGHD